MPQDRTDLEGDPSVDEVLDRLEKLEGTVDADEEREEVQRVRRAVERLPGSSVVGSRIDKYTSRDVAEGFVGGILLSLPLLVEDGVYDIGDHFLETTVGGVPVFLVANVGFVVALTWGLLYWTEFRRIEGRRPLFGLIPRRVLGVLVISLTTATLTMTMWGRVEGWSEPDVAVARISVIWAAAAFGAALGDILPGESRGEDLGDVVEDAIDDVAEVIGDD